MQQLQQIGAIAFDPKIRLGQGGYSSVFAGTWNNQDIAVKRVESIDTEDKEENALRQLTHVNVVKLLEIESDNAFKYFALERCKASLDQLFPANSNIPKYDGPRLPYHFTVLHQLASGLEYIHSKNLVHRDVKPENVLIHVDSDEKVTMKWADFGLSKQINERGTFTMSGVKGSMSWMAPELLKERNQGRNNPGHKARGTVKSDVFAEGCVFGYFLSDGIHPFGDADYEIPSNIAKNKLDDLNKKIKSSYACRLIERMVHSDVKERITSKIALEQINSDIEELKQKEPKLFELLKAPEVNLEEVRTLIHDGVDVNCVNSDGCTPLLYLAKVSKGKRNLKNAMELLLSFPIDVNKKEKRGYNALHLLCWFYQQEDLIDIVVLLIDKGIDVTLIEDNEGCNALHLLCENYRMNNLIRIIRLLIKNRIDINRKNKDGWNVLHILCQNYKNENLSNIVRLLIKKGIDVQSSENNEMKCNALHLICENYREKNLNDIIQVLIDNKIDVNSKNKDGWNGLHFACKHYDRDDLIQVVRLFINRGIDVNAIEGNDGCNALHLVCENYQNSNLINIIQEFIEKGINVNTKNHDGWNALHFACQNYKNENMIAIVELFLANGIKVHTKTNKGWNALLILCRHYFNANLNELVRFLIENGIDVNWKNNQKWNALHFICKYYCNDNLIDIIKLLIEHKIDVNCTTNEGNALLLLSKNYSNDKLIDIIQLLMEHKVDLNYRTNEGNALHLLCKYYPNKNLINILKLFIDKGMNWNCIDPRILIRQNPNQKFTDDYRQLFEHIPPTTVGNKIEIIESSSNGILPVSNGHS